MSLFRERCERAGGQVHTFDSKDAIKSFLQGIFSDFEEIFVHPELADLIDSPNPQENKKIIREETPPPAPGSKCLGIVNARLGVAETGSVVLLEQASFETRLNTLSSTLFVLIEKDKIQHSLTDCNSQIRELTLEGWITFVTGVSCTGDIELVTVRGIQGPEELLVAIY